MKVLIAHADEGGCGHYRLLWPADVLRNEGHEITIDGGGDTIHATWSPDGTVTSVEPIDADVVIFQRPLTAHVADAIPFIQKNGSAVVVELDDDFWSIDRRNAAAADAHPENNPYRNHQHLTRACKAADLVTVSTPALAKKIPNQVRILRNMIPESYLAATVKDDAPWHKFEGRTAIVGWTGSPKTHPGDLAVMGTSLVHSVRKTGAVFFAIGSARTGGAVGFAPGESAFTGHADDPDATWVPLDEYPRVIKGLDIGIVPLRMSEFNEAKSYLKGLEYAALGVSFVASPTGEYRRLNAAGAGDLAPYKHDWERALTKLITNATYRSERALAGVEVAEGMTYEKNAWQWMDAWEQAVRLRKVSA